MGFLPKISSPPTGMGAEDKRKISMFSQIFTCLQLPHLSVGRAEEGLRKGNIIQLGYFVFQTLSFAQQYRQKTPQKPAKSQRILPHSKGSAPCIC